MKKQKELAVSKPRVPQAVLAVLHSKKGGAMRDKRNQTRSAAKRALSRELCH